MSLVVPVLFIVLILGVAYLVSSVRSLKRELDSTRSMLNATRSKLNDTRNSVNLALRHAEGAKQNAAAMERRVTSLGNAFEGHRDSASIHFPTDGIENMVNAVDDKVGRFSAALEGEEKRRMTAIENLRRALDEHNHDGESAGEQRFAGVEKALDRIEAMLIGDDENPGYVPYGAEVRTRKTNGRFGPTYSLERPTSDGESDSA